MFQGVNGIDTLSPVKFEEFTEQRYSNGVKFFKSFGEISALVAEILHAFASR